MTEKRKNIDKVPNLTNHFPKLRFPEFSGEWEVKKLGDLLEFKNGINASKEQYGQGVKFVNVSDILNNDFLTYDNIIGFVDIDNSTLSKYSVEYGDILFQRSSETREEVGTANVYLDKEKTATFGGFVIRGKKIGKYEPIFFNHLLKTFNARNSITTKSGGSTRYNVGQETLSSVKLYFPSIEEQNKISSFLNLLDERISSSMKTIQNLETLIKGVSRKLFTQKIRFKEFADEWEVKKLGEVLNEPKQVPVEKPNEVELLTVKLHCKGIENTGDYPAVTKNGRPYYRRFKNEILIGRQNFHNGGIGIVKGENDGKICSNAISSYNVLTDNLLFVYFYISRPQYYTRVDDLIGGTGQKEISKSEFSKLKINIPCIEEQTKIADFLSKISDKIETEKKILELLEQQKKYFLQNMFI